VSSGRARSTFSAARRHGLVDEGNALRVRRIGDDAGTRRRLHRLDALDVVGVVMGDEDVADGPAPGLGGRQGRRGVRHVDRGGGAGGRIMDERAEIVAQAGEHVDFGSHAGLQG
jgi:hypothetical protein